MEFWASYLDEKTVSMSDLPTEILFHICSKLDFKSLIRIGQTCKKLQDISHEESLWKQLCKDEYLLTEKSEDVETWCDQFRQYHNRIGRYHSPSVYRAMRRLWDRLENYLRDNDPQILKSLRGPCSISEILIAEEKLECRFPPDLRCSLLMHNGQQMCHGIGVLGCMAIASYYSSEGLLDAASMARHFDPWGDLPGCVPITYCYNSQTSQYIGVDDSNGYKVGEVFYPIHCIPNPPSDVDTFVTGSTYMEWFENLVHKLENNLFPRIDDRIYRFEHDPDCVARTRDCFTMTASTCFIPEASTVNPGHFLHVYRITMSMDKDADPSLSCQLETRHWVITDMDGIEQRVDGEGVVGEFPVMRPGVSFSWTSCTTFPTTYGSMRGSFTMRTLQTDEEIEIICPTFKMKCLPYKLASERKLFLMSRKKRL